MTQTVEVKVKNKRQYEKNVEGEEEMEIPDEYNPVRKARYSSQRQVTQAFINGKFPTHNVVKMGVSDKLAGKIYSSDNFKGYLYSEGKGKIMHYRTKETIRTKNGLIIVNSQCYSGGFAHCSPPSHSRRDGTLPLTTINREIDNSMYDIVSVESGDKYGSPTLAEFEDSSGVAVINDETSKRRGSVVFKVTKKEMEELNDPAELPKLLKPELVEYYEDYGRDVVRQGEWFFVPQEDLEVPKDKVIKRLKQCRDSDGNLKRWSDGDDYLGSHIPRDMFITADGRVFVRGTVRHIRNEHEMVNLGETWHLAFKERYKDTYIAEPQGGSKAD